MHLLLLTMSLLTLCFSLHATPNMTQKLNAGRMKILSWSPRIFLFEDFLTESECDHLIAEGKSQLTRSTVIDEHSQGGKIHPTRTSEGMFFPQHSSDPIIQKIERKIAAVTMLPLENGEAIQMLHYGPGAEYRPHFDYFDPTTEGGKFCYDRGGQRIASFIMYLYTTEEGGETLFPKAGIEIKPIKGNAVLFYNCLPDGTEDPLSLHGGAPVIKGDKWIATKWIRKAEFK